MARPSAKGLTTFLAAGAVAFGLTAASASAATVRVTVLGSLWDVSTVTGSFDSLSSTLMAQDWWGTGNIFSFFVQAVNTQLGTPNGGTMGPFFSFASDPGSGQNRYVAFQNGATIVGSTSNTSNDTYAIATPVVAPVPLPAGGALLLTGIAAALGFRRRKRQAV